MISSFKYSGNAAQVIFGNGALSKLADVAKDLGVQRLLILSTPFQESEALRLADELGALSVGIFAKAAMHTPVATTELAMQAYLETGADCVLSYGGGSTIGLGKAIAHRNNTPQIVVATTYAGSEVTPILGQTENGIKTTLRGPQILPEVVIYDPELTLGLPVKMSITSGLNAMAHAFEALYARDQNPISSMMALEGIRALKTALPAIVNDPGNLEARGDALYGSWLCGTVLGNVGMALHHKLCHTLGGSFDMPHAETHAVLLPHTVSYNQIAASEVLKPASDLFDGDLGAGLYDFAKKLGAPLSLEGLGLQSDSIGKAAEIATTNPYWNPREITHEGILALLNNAFEGKRPVFENSEGNTK